MTDPDDTSMFDEWTGGFSLDSDEGGSTTAPGPQTVDPGFTPDPNDGGTTEPDYSYDPGSGGSTDPGPQSRDWNPDPNPNMTPDEIDEVTGGPIDGGEVLDWVGGKLADAAGGVYGLAYEVAHMSDDMTPEQRSAQVDYQAREDNEYQMTEDRNAQLTEDLNPVVEMDAPADREWNSDEVDMGEIDEPFAIDPDDRDAQLTQDLQPHVVEMDAPAEPEYDAPVDYGEVDAPADYVEAPSDTSYEF